MTDKDPKGLRRVAAGVALLVVGQTLAMAACTAPAGLVAPTPVPAQDSLRVWVLGTGYHAAVLLEQPPDARLGPPGQESAPFVELAWGDRRFYMDGARHWLPLTLFWPTESVVYVQAWDAPPASSEGLRVLKKRRVDAPTWHALVTELERAFIRTPEGARAAPHAPADPYPGRFYAGRRPYAAWYTCNTWVVGRLGGAGLTRPGLPVLLVDQIPGRLQGFSRVQGPGPDARPPGHPADHLPQPEPS